MIAVMKVDDAQAYLDRYEKAVANLNSLYKELKIPGFDQSFSVKKTTIGTVRVLEVATQLANLGNDPAQRKMIEAMFGPGGKMTTSIAAADDTTVILSYKPAAAMSETLQAHAMKKGGLQDDARLAGASPCCPRVPNGCSSLTPAAC